jgi:hypothetical protein
LKGDKMSEEYYLCKHCWERKDFQRTVIGEVSFSEIEYINGKGGEVTECGEYEEHDRYNTDAGNPECSNCGSDTDIEIFETNAELLNFIWLHKTKDNKYSPDILPEEERDKEYLMNEVAENI